MARSTLIPATGGTTKRRPSSNKPSNARDGEDKPEFVPTKIQKFRDACAAHDWDLEEQWFEQDYRVKAWRNEGEERITLIWRERYFSGDGESWYNLVDVEDGTVLREKLLSNQAEAIRFVIDQPDYTFVRDEDGRPALIRNVFDWTEYEDEEVAKNLAGHTITWQNSYTGEHEKGIVPRKGYWTEVQRSSVGRRFITFADASGGGFRSVGLDAIIRIK